MPGEDSSPISQDAYDRMAPEYDDITGAPIREHYEWPTVESLLPPLDGLTVLDAACGDGYYTESLVENGATVVGVDASQEMVSRARHRLDGDERVSVRQADLTEGLSFLDDEQFDLVICQLALEHVRDWASVFRTFARVLEPGGTAVISSSHPVRDYVDAEFPVREQILTESATYDAIEQVNRNWGDDEDFIVPFYRRPLEAVFGPATDAGLLIETVVEPAITETFREKRPDLATEFSQGPPNFICLRFLKPT